MPTDYMARRSVITKRGCEVLIRSGQTGSMNDLNLPGNSHQSRSGIVDYSRPWDAHSIDAALPIAFYYITSCHTLILNADVKLIAIVMLRANSSGKLS